jgi:phosphoenolpyruvate phosphomutase
MNKAILLRQLLRRPQPVVLAGAHNGLSARLVQEAGFDAVWASGFEISASHGVPDANILTMAENLAVTKNINDSVSIPVVADCDNGYGNAINVMRMVEEYEKAGIAGVCIEDNVFPKRCSFYAGVRRELETIEEFSGKIRAAKRTQRHADFVVTARTEALIAGWGMEEALARARAYAEAGADLILIHSKSSSPQQVMEFARAWTLETPLVAVPTTYKTTSVTDLAAAGFKMVIFANHALRASIKAMRETLSALHEAQFAASVDDLIVPLESVYELIGVDQLQENEAQYLPVAGEQVTAIIVAAGVGFANELMSLIADRPKAMLDVKGKTILERQVEALNACSIKDIAVVRGYKKEKINLPNLRYYDNDRYAETHNLASLFCAESELNGRVVFLYGDIVFDRSILEKLLKSSADLTLVVDHAWYDNHLHGIEHPVSRPELVKTMNPPMQRDRFLPSETNRVLRIGRTIPKSEAHAEFIGMAMFSERGMGILKETYYKAKRKYAGRPFHEAPTFERASFGDLVQELIDQDVEIACIDIYKGWMEVDTFEDYREAWAKIKK